MESSTYPDKKYIESSRMWVNVAAHNEKTHEVDAIIGGKKVTVCSAYWNIPCSVHSACYRASSKFEGIKGLPTTVYTDPDGKEIGREVGGKSASELVKIQADLLEKIPGEKISVVEWNQAKKLVADAESAFAKGEWKKSVEAYVKVTKLPKKSLKDMATTGIEKLETKGRELIEDAKQKLGEREEQRKLLKKVAEDFKPLACSKEAAAALKEIPADEKK